jgi:hypothetical protein
MRGICTQHNGSGAGCALTAVAGHRLGRPARESPEAWPPRRQRRGVQYWRVAGAAESRAYWAGRWVDRPADRGAPGRWAAVWAERKARAMVAAQVEEPRERPAEARQPPAAR